MCEVYAKATWCSFHDFAQFGGKDILIESMFVEKCPVTGGALTLPDRTFFICFCIRACLKNHSCNLHASLCGTFVPNSVAVA